MCNYFAEEKYSCTCELLYKKIVFVDMIEKSLHIIVTLDSTVSKNNLTYFALVEVKNFLFEILRYSYS